jgi:hypothetical protein
MPTIQVLVVMDEFEFEFEDRDVEGRWDALPDQEDVVLVSHETTGCCVTLTGRKLTLWNPEIHWADQFSRSAGNTLVDSVALAATWLSDYLKVPHEHIEQTLDVHLFR